jgi:hypothetical protein
MKEFKYIYKHLRIRLLSEFKFSLKNIMHSYFNFDWFQGIAPNAISAYGIQSGGVTCTGIEKDAVRFNYCFSP